MVNPMGQILSSSRTSPSNGAGLFLKRWLRRPLHIGAVAPSGAALSRAMATTVLSEEGAAEAPIIELGAGTGSFTAALRDHGLERERLISVERDPELYAWLRKHFPGLRLVAGDAADLKALLAGEGVTRAGVVFSGLPLLSMPRPIVRAILQGALSVLVPRGAFVQFTYGAGPPVPRALLEELGLEATHGPRIWLNVPPAVIWTFRRRKR
jgi:phosphatidylethanolamine/phosphatidyl-N-methylethanolamine N-methyltransferase